MIYKIYIKKENKKKCLKFLLNIIEITKHELKSTVSLPQASIQSTPDLKNS